MYTNNRGRRDPELRLDFIISNSRRQAPRASVTAHLGRLSSLSLLALSPVTANCHGQGNGSIQVIVSIISTYVVSSPLLLPAAVPQSPRRGC